MRPLSTAVRFVGVVALGGAHDGSKDGEVIVQIIGLGPVRTTDVDAQGRPTGRR